MQLIYRNHSATNAKLIIDGAWTEYAVSDLNESHGAFVSTVSVSAGASVVACILGIGALPGRIVETNHGSVTIEFGAIAAAAAVRLSECAARTY